LENLLIELALDAEISKVLWIGNSHINRQIMQAFHRRNKFSLTLCTRDVGGARSFAEEREIALIGWEALELWHSWDMIICATRHDEYLIKSCPASKQRLLIDLSMPRLIDPAIAMDRSIHLLNIEELAERVAVRREGLREKMENSKQFLHEAVAASLEAYQKRASRRYAGLLA
jgi:glutamyl-tRNA reductase